MTSTGEQPRGAPGPDTAERGHEYVGKPPASRDVWFWVQVIGLGSLTAGVAVLVVFALTLGGR